MGAWTRLSGETPHEVIVIRPPRCPNGHLLRAPNLNSGSDVSEAWYECLTCGLTIHRDHRALQQWVTINATTDQRADIPGFDPYPDTMEGVMLADRITPP